MQYLNRLAWVMVILAVTAAPILAQQVPLPTQGGQGGQGAGGQGAGGQGAGGQGGSGQFEATPLVTFEAPPQITAPTGSGGGAVDPSNFLSGYYANPLFQGTIDNARNATAPGGFGQATYTAGTGGGAGGLGGAGGARGATGQQARTGGIAGQRGIGGIGGIGGLGRQTAASQSGTVLPMQVQIAYPAMLGRGFDATPLPAARVQADVSGMFARATSVIPGAANVQVIAQDDVVTLRGTVADVDEARLIEGMTRMTPGVRAIRNELTFPISKR